jgi:hypothetical protein
MRAFGTFLNLGETARQSQYRPALPVMGPLSADFVYFSP